MAVDPVDERYLAALRIIRQHRDAIGSGQLARYLRQDGVEVSEATAGRLLRDLELQGLLRKDSRRGRVLTPQGEHWFEERKLQEAYIGRGRQLTDFLQSVDRDHIMQVMAARRAVEGETAALAARMATPDEIAQLDKIVAASREHLAQGTYAADDDDQFHHTIAVAGRNRVLETVVRLIRESQGVSEILMQIRNRVGRKSLSDHEAVLQAIRSRDPEMARAAMLFHVERVRNDAVQVWKEIDESGRGTRHRQKRPGQARGVPRATQSGIGQEQS